MIHPRRKIRTAGFVVSLALVLQACASAGAPERSAANPTLATHEISGTVVLPAFGDASNRMAVCEPWTSLLDIQPGVEVIIRDQSGSIVAKSVLDTPDGNPSGYSADKETCLYAFKASSVPDANFYSVQVGQRDGPTYSRDELTKSNWTMTLSLTG